MAGNRRVKSSMKSSTLPRRFRSSARSPWRCGSSTPDTAACARADRGKRRRDDGAACRRAPAARTYPSGPRAREAIQERRHRADVERVRAQPQQVVQEPVISSNITRMYSARIGTSMPAARWRGSTRARWTLSTRNRAGPCTATGHRSCIRQASRSPGAEPVRVRALDDLAVELQHQAQDAVRRRMLGAEVHGVVADLGHGQPLRNLRSRQFSSRMIRGVLRAARWSPAGR